MQKRPIYRELASTIDARLNCIKSNNTEWKERHEEKINRIIDDLPHGSGIDGTTRLDFERSTGERIVITSEYHAMTETGMYDRWIDFRITLTASLRFGMDMVIAGNFGKYQDVKEYLYDVFGEALSRTPDPEYYEYEKEPER